MREGFRTPDECSVSPSPMCRALETACIHRHRDRRRLTRRQKPMTIRDVFPIPREPNRDVCTKQHGFRVYIYIYIFCFFFSFSFLEDTDDVANCVRSGILVAAFKRAEIRERRIESRESRAAAAANRSVPDRTRTLTSMSPI